MERELDTSDRKLQIQQGCRSAIQLAIVLFVLLALAAWYWLRLHVAENEKLRVEHSRYGLVECARYLGMAAEDIGERPKTLEAAFDSLGKGLEDSMFYQHPSDFDSVEKILYFPDATGKAADLKTTQGGGRGEATLRSISGEKVP